MLTFKHFIDRPTWAAAAGYDFNFLDCMSFMAIQYDRVFGALLDVCDDFFSTELRELPLIVLVVLAAISGVIVWPFIFWIVAVPLWVKCKRMRNKYQFGSSMNDIAKNNIEVWLCRCAKKWEAV
ncbi:TPA: hypothetical protein ACQ431_002974 [Citrobacter murliniae]